MRAPVTFPDEDEPDRQPLPLQFIGLQYTGSTTAMVWCPVNPVHDYAWGANGRCWCGAALVGYATTTSTWTRHEDLDGEVGAAVTRAHALLLAKVVAILAFDVVCAGRILGWW